MGYRPLTRKYVFCESRGVRQRGEEIQKQETVDQSRSCRKLPGRTGACRSRCQREVAWCAKAFDEKQLGYHDLGELKKVLESCEPGCCIAGVPGLQNEPGC